MGQAFRGVVILADDEDLLRESAQEMFEDEGFIVLPARDGHEALARMQGITGPVVALVDLAMPGMDGGALMDAMAHDEALARIPVVVISSRLTHDRVQDGRHYVRKPFRNDALIRLVTDLCGASAR